MSDWATGKVVEVIKATPEHPFFTTHGLVSAENLGIGTELVTRAGPSKAGNAPALVVKSVTPVPAVVGKDGKRAGFVVYNLEVEDDHTYFVGNANGGVWVHNACALGEAADAYNAATARYKGGPLSVAGRALAKHGVRPGSLFPAPQGGPAAINDLAHEIVSEILQDPGTIRIGHGPVFDLVAPNGRGLRFYANGDFRGLLE